MLWGPTDLIDVVEGRSFVWPIAVTLFDTVLHQWGQHDNHSAATLPHHLRTETQLSGPLASLALVDLRGLLVQEKPPPRVHLPEVCDGVGQRSLGGNVGWHPRVMLDLRVDRIWHEAE